MTTQDSTILHIPTPGDHYSPASGSAVMTVIYELSRWHDRAGGETRLLVGEGTRHDYPVGQCTEVKFPKLPDRNHKIADALFGRVGLPRRFIESVYQPGFDAIQREFAGAAIVHNAPAALRGLKRAAPNSRAVLYAHNSLFTTYARHEIRSALALADVVICVSRFLAEQLTWRLGTADSRICGITNGVDIERFRPAAAKSEVPVVLFVGRVLPEKGPDLLMKAAARLMEGKRRFKVRIVGSSNFNAADPLTAYEQELRTLAVPLGDCVEFIPFVDRAGVLEQYHQASIFCAPSNWDEPCSLTVPEAMACGLPTIASRRGGIPEVGGDAVKYFNPPDVDELAQQLEHLLDNEEARNSWGKKARAQALTLSWQSRYELVRAALFAE